MEIQNEGYLLGYPNIYPYTCIKEIINQMEKSLCKIKIEPKKQGTGFPCRIPFPTEKELLPVLITNNHFLNDEKWETIENTVEASKDNSFLQKENIINLLKNLTIREQEVLIYLYVLEKTPKEISDYLNLSVKTISNTKTRALNKLGKIIKRG